MGRHHRIAELAQICVDHQGGSTDPESDRPDSVDSTTGHTPTADAPTSDAPTGDTLTESVDASGSFTTTGAPETGRSPAPIEIADLATGQGLMARALLDVATCPVRIHCVGMSENAVPQVRDNPAIVEQPAASTTFVPFERASMDRIISLNVIEQYRNPAEHLRECYNTLRPGGILVLVNSDWDTTLFASHDDALTRTLVDRFVAQTPPWADYVDGYMGRKLLGLARASDLSILSITTWADIHRRFDEDSLASKVAQGVLAAAASDAQLAAAAADWVAGLHRLAQEDRFLFTVTDVCLVLQRPIESAS